MAINEKTVRRESEGSHKTKVGEATVARANILQNKWVQGALIAMCLFLIYFVTGSKSNPFDQYVRLADAFLHGRLYLQAPPDYLELARYFDSGLACKGPEVGCKGYVSTRRHLRRC